MTEMTKVCIKDIRYAGWRRTKQKLFRVMMFILAMSMPVLLLGLIAFLLINAWPALHFNGFGFLASNNWNLGSQYGTPVTVDGTEILPGASYGVLFLIIGTLASSAIALLLAVPIGVAGAIFIAEIIPERLRDSVAAVVELLAAVPSVVFGLWGYTVLIPIFSHHLYPLIANILGFIPFFAGPVGSGYGLLTAGVVLALMVVPIITANIREAIHAVNRQDIEAGRALGATRFEVVRRIVLPQLRSALIGVSILALGRALGETMAVLMVSGNALGIPRNIYDTISTMASFIVSQLDSALQDPTGMAVHSLTEVGLVLLIISITVNAIARLLMLSGQK